MKNIQRERATLADRIALYLFEIAVKLMSPRRRIITSAVFLQSTCDEYGPETVAMALQAAAGDPR